MAFLLTSDFYLNLLSSVDIYYFNLSLFLYPVEHWRRAYWFLIYDSWNLPWVLDYILILLSVLRFIKRDICIFQCSIIINGKNWLLNFSTKKFNYCPLTLVGLRLLNFPENFLYLSTWDVDRFPRGDNWGHKTLGDALRRRSITYWTTRRGNWRDL